MRALVDQVTRADLAVIASPTYKAAYTGLLKAFLDWFAKDQLAAVTVVPVMVGAAPEHALAVEVHLRPVLVELGASLPTRGLYVLESDLGDLDAVLEQWLVTAGPQLASCVQARAVARSSFATSSRTNGMTNRPNSAASSRVS